MRVTPPITITPSRLTSSTATDIHAPAAYAGGTTYAFGAIVSVAADYQIYESLAAANTGNTPLSSPLWWRILGPTETAYDNTKINYALGQTASANQRVYESRVLQTAVNPLPVLPETQTNFWIDVGPTNKYAMFDLSANTQTVTASPMTVVIPPGQRINTVGLTGLVGNSLTISATSVFGGGTVYNKVIDLNSREVADGYDYAFEPFSTDPTAVVFDVSPYSDIIVTITITSTSGNVKCGSCVLGTFIYLGDAERGAANDGLNFSTVTRDLYGSATLVPRRTLPKTTQKLRVPAARVNKVKAARVLLNAKPALWTGLDDSSNSYADMLTVLGIYTQFVITASYPTHAEVTLSLEEI